MKRNLLSILLTLTIAITLTIPALADVIWEPDDAFYTRHAQECTYVGRRYKAAGYDGSLTVYAAPGGLACAEIENGIKVNIQFTWSGEGLDWGYALYTDWGEEAGGWVPMDDLALVYDSRQFMEDHQGEIAEEQVEVEFTQAVLYDYPGGPAGYVLEEHPDYMTFSQLINQVYTDESGLRWGYIGYYMGRRESWVCLDDPMNETLDTAVVAPGLSAAQLRGAPTVTGGFSWQMLLAAVLLVAAVVVCTVILIRRFCPKKDIKL